MRVDKSTRIMSPDFPDFEKYVMCMIIFFFMLFITLFFSCSDDEPTLSQKAKVKVLSDHTVKLFKGYEIPYGEFFEYKFPMAYRNSFQACVGHPKEIICYDIAAPKGFKHENKGDSEFWQRTDESWDFTLENNDEHAYFYKVSKKDGSKSMIIELPATLRHYHFAVLPNQTGQELIVFGNISSYASVIGNGFFGYVMID